MATTSSADEQPVTSVIPERFQGLSAVELAAQLRSEGLRPVIVTSDYPMSPLEGYILITVAAGTDDVIDIRPIPR